MDFVVGKGRCKVFFEVKEVGADIVVIITGGKVHIGAVGLSVIVPSIIKPGENTITSYMITVPAHKEEEIVVPIARKLARGTEKTCLVVVGIHLDDITAKEIEEIVENCNIGVEKINENFTKQKTS